MRSLDETISDTVSYRFSAGLFYHYWIEHHRSRNGRLQSNAACCWHEKQNDEHPFTQFTEGNLIYQNNRKTDAINEWRLLIYWKYQLNNKDSLFGRFHFFVLKTQTQSTNKVQMNICSKFLISKWCDVGDKINYAPEFPLWFRMLSFDLICWVCSFGSCPVHDAKQCKGSFV